MFLIPDDFARFIEIQHGANGPAWLARLPAILSICEQRWHLKIGIPFTNLSYHYVVPAIRDDGSSVVVKVFSPTGEFALQTEALHLFDPDAYVQALQAEGMPVGANELASLNGLPSVFIPLISVMQEKKKWAYQEGITALLVHDILERLS